MNQIFYFFIIVLFLGACAQENSLDMKKVTIPDPVVLKEGASMIDYPDNAIKFLKEKLALTRLPEEIPNTAGVYGYSKNDLKALLDYWENEFDFAAHLNRLNEYTHSIADVEGVKLHYILEKSDQESAIPIVLLHGWPSTFLQMQKLMPLLKTSNEGIAFDLVIISLPGYGFSEIPSQKGMAVHKMADLMHQLMTKKLGYEQFLIRGSDIGAGVAKEWALAYPDQVLGLHLSGSNPYIYYTPQDLSEKEKVFVQNAQQFMQQNGAYAVLNSTEPQTLAYGLNDSPAGLAAWILQRYESWADHSGNLESVFTKNDLLDILTVYWMTGTINASMRSYYESAHVYSPNAGKTVDVPVAFLMLQNDIAVAPQEWEARTYSNIILWNEHPKGGHFGEWEAPKMLANDIRQFAKSLVLLR